MTNPWVRPLPTNIMEIVNGQAGTIIPPTNTLVLGRGYVHCPDLIIYLDNPDSYVMNLHLGGKHRMTADRTGFINNYIEGDGTLGYAGLLSTTGKDQLTYGNIIRNCQHGLYIQNKNTDGIEYVPHNYIGDCVPSDNSRSIHGYTQQPDNLWNMRFVQNVVNGNEFLIGGEVNSTEPMNNSIESCWIHDASVNLGYRRAEATDMINNRMYRSPVFETMSRGVGDPNQEAYVRTGNQFYNPNMVDVFQFHTEPAGSNIRTVDVRDSNVYYSNIRGDFNAGGVHQYFTSLQQFRDLTRAAGKEFDTNSQFIAGAPPAQYWIIRNDYDPLMAMLVVWGVKQVPLPLGAKVATVTDPYNYVNPPATFGVNDKLNVWRIKYGPTSGARRNHK